MVKIVHFHCKSHRFDPWSEKFHMPCSLVKKKKNMLRDGSLSIQSVLSPGRNKTKFFGVKFPKTRLG